VRQPHPLDTNAIITALREHGSVLWPLDAIPGEFTGWRHQIRAAARSAGLRISVRRIDGLVFIGHVDHVVTDDQINAFNKVIAGTVSAALMDGTPITYEQALHEAKRDRLKTLDQPADAPFADPNDRPLASRASTFTSSSGDPADAIHVGGLTDGSPVGRPPGVPHRSQPSSSRGIRPTRSRLRHSCSGSASTGSGASRPGTLQKLGVLPADYGCVQGSRQETS
jgi:hypothetical protein